jgi:MFS family permease
VSDRRDTRLIVGAVGISALGDFLLWIPLTLQLQRMTSSGLVVAGLVICLWTPAVVLAPFAGSLVDRHDARRVLLLASLAQAALALALVPALDSMTAILVVAGFLGIGFAIAQPAEFALVAAIAGPDRRIAVNGSVEAARYTGTIAGPLLGGALAAAGGTRIAMVVNAATFLVVAAAAILVRTRRAPVPVDAAAPGRARDGIVLLLADRTLRVVLMAIFASLLFMSASITAEVFFIKQDLGASDVVYGAVFSCWAVGMVAGALLVARRIRSGLAFAALIAVAVQGAGLGLPTAWLAVGFAAAAWFVGGMGHGTKNVLARTLIQERVPDAFHGRAFAAYNGLRNAAELVALAAGGVLVSAIGARSTLALAGAVPVAAALLGLAILLRRVEPSTELSPAVPVDG